MTLEQLLSKKGYTAQEIADLGPMLQNARFRKDLESELTDMETTVAAAKKDLDGYDTWFTQEITPEHERLVRERADALADAAAAKARFEAYQKTGMRTQAERQDPTAAAAAEAERKKAEATGFDPSKYVSAQTFQDAYEKTGEAIANSADLTSEFMQLYPGQFLNMSQMREESKKAKKSIRQYVEEKYNFSGKKAEVAAKVVADNEARIRADERAKVAVEFGTNPNVARMVPSNHPFVERKKADAGKQPWEKNDAELARNRIDNAIKKAATRGEMVS